MKLESSAPARSVVTAKRQRPASAENVRVTATKLRVELVDGRTVAVPLGWYPRLAHGSPAERRDWRLVGRGKGIHWPALDEDISVDDLLLGHPSGESQASRARWLAKRSKPGRSARAARS